MIHACCTMENTLLVIQYNTNPEGRLQLKNPIISGITISIDFCCAISPVAVSLLCRKVVAAARDGEYEIRVCFTERPNAKNTAVWSTGISR